MCIRDRYDSPPEPDNPDRAEQGVCSYLFDDLLRDRNHKTKPLMFVGHSLGGALATLACRAFVAVCNEKYPHLRDRFLKPREHKEGEGFQDSKLSLWTLGSPKVGDTRFAQLLQDNVPDMWRIFCDSDPVPSLPPQPRCGGNPYVHVGTEVMLRTTDLEISPPMVRDETG
eukprot:TRINITY_DN5547_c0_g1_i2.p2 TRINITY_DN5547_c0_g1~~TRINITY_DN5547_c0_g1_i2.p2  ORF type:complete len:170 (-),score=37.65 TRINITY_DN5547_c0_g1_i2:13-522(-)